MDYKTLLTTKIKDKVDIVYIDPPYNSDFAIKSIETIINEKIVNEKSIIIIETDNEETMLKELEKEQVEIQDKRKYGRATLIFLKIRKG